MATTMQPEIPWNVAGIAPEARDAARTSARREGLSVGEWLTRRILRGLPEAEGATDEWWFAETGRNRTPSNENPARNGHRHHDEPLQNLLPRTSESRSESRGPSGNVAVQIKPAARNQSENPEQLEERIVRLDARIARVEIRTAAEEAKHAETIKALHARMAALTDQLSKAVSHSAMQDAQLAKAIEAVTGKFLQSNSEADEARSALTARVAALAEDTAFIGEKIETTRETGERQVRTIEARVAATEAAVEAASRGGDEVDRLGGSLDHLARRFEETETEYLNNVERIEGRLTRIEANSGDAIIDQRLQGIEQALADMAKLIERNAPEKPTAKQTIEQPETASSQSDVTELRDESPLTTTSGARTAMPILDLPPFPEKPKSSTTPPDFASSLYDLRAPAQAATIPDPAKRSTSAEVESFLAAARRSARGEVPPQPRSAPFSWVDPTGPNNADATHTRLILLGGLGLLVVAAIGTGLYFSTNVSQAPGASRSTVVPVHVMATQRPSSVQMPTHPTQSALPPASVAKQVSVSAAPGAAPAPIAVQSGSPPAAVQNRLIPPPGIVRTAPAPASAPAKPLTPQQRLAALAASGNTNAEEVLGLAYLDGDGTSVNEAEGAKWLERAARHGEAVAAYRLGTLYERGHGVAADAAKAMQWYAVAAKAGNRKAMHNLAVAYAQGSGGQKDLSLAAQWFSRAANLGLADSQFNLAVLYERGLGVPQNLGEAYKWYAIATAQGDTESRARMQVIAPQLTADVKAAAEKSAAAFQPAQPDRAANAPPIAASLIGAG